MELWFWSAVAGTVFAGLSNFYFKQAAVRGYNAETFSMYGSLLSLILVGLLFIWEPVSVFNYHWIGLLAFGGGLLAALTNVFKIYALRYVDSTIYFPLFKLIAPAIAVIAGVLLFNESFSHTEWVGIVLGLFVPLLLITKGENHRQNNLLLGMLLIFVTSATSASTAIANKYSIDASLPVNVVMLYTLSGIFLGSIMASITKIGVYASWTQAQSDFNTEFLLASGLRSGLIFISFWLMLYAFSVGGPLAIVQTINSLYILIPIILSIIFYKEHWNWQKFLAVALSVVALAFLG